MTHFATKRMAYGLLAILFFINEAATVIIDNYLVWLGLDYAFRIGVISFLSIQMTRHVLSPKDLSLACERKDKILATTLIFGTIAFAYSFASHLYLTHIPYPGLGSPPAPTSNYLATMDQYLGLLLVASSEELVFRGLALSALKEFRFNSVTIVGLSSTIYTTAYWTHSAEALLGRLSLGIIFMLSTMFSKSIIPAIIIHYLILVLRYG